MFKGWHERTIDDKGRLSIPPRFRGSSKKKSNTTFTITIGKDGCLDVYPQDKWVELENQIATAPKFNHALIAFKRSYISPAQDCTVDNQGRIIIPQSLRNVAGLDHDVMLVGQVTLFEIWDKNSWQNVFKQSQKDLNWSEIEKLGL